jgi:hypothetical protein
VLQHASEFRPPRLLPCLWRFGPEFLQEDRDEFLRSVRRDPRDDELRVVTQRVRLGEVDDKVEQRGYGAASHRRSASDAASSKGASCAVKSSNRRTTAGDRAAVEASSASIAASFSGALVVLAVSSWARIGASSALGSRSSAPRVAAPRSRRTTRKATMTPSVATRPRKTITGSAVRWIAAQHGSIR